MFDMWLLSLDSVVFLGHCALYKFSYLLTSKHFQSVVLLQINDENLSGWCDWSRPTTAGTWQENTTCRYWWPFTRHKWCSVESWILWMLWNSTQVWYHAV